MPAIKEFKTIPQMFSNLVLDFGKNAQHAMLKYRVKDEWKDVSYAEVKSQTVAFACGLALLGFKRGDKVAIIAENRPEWVYSDMAILALGGADVPLYPSLTADSIEFILNNSECTGVIVSNKFQLNKVLKIRHNCKHLKYIIVMNDKDVPPDMSYVKSFETVTLDGKQSSRYDEAYFWQQAKMCNENDICTIIYTSGTTGEPKGVLLSHKNIISNVNDVLKIIPLSETDTFLSFLPLCHIFERMAGYYTALSCGGMVAYAQSIESVSSDLLSVKPTIMTSVPRFCRICESEKSQSSTNRT